MSSERQSSGWLWVLAGVGTLMLVVGFFFIRFDVVSATTATVEAVEDAVVYAPRAARVQAILVEPGESVTKGQALMVLASEDLDGEIADIEEALGAAEKEETLAALRVRELDLTGGRAGSLVAEPVARLQGEIEATLKEVRAIYQRLQASSGASRLQVLNHEAELLRFQTEMMHHRELLALNQAGYLDLLKEREESVRQLAQKRTLMLTSRLEQLRSERNMLTVRSPLKGVITDVYVRDPDEWLQAGGALASVADPTSGYEVNGFLTGRNIDLIRPGLPVRMESNVYNSSTEGYLHGTVQRIVTDSRSASGEGFRVVVSVDESPHPPVIGSTVSMEVIIDDVGPLGLLFQEPLRAQKNTREPSSIAPQAEQITAHEN